jgi:hypothetical protein
VSQANTVNGLPDNVGTRIVAVVSPSVSQTTLRMKSSTTFGRLGMLFTATGSSFRFRGRSG